ncbi:hypothetical protein ACWTU6_28595 [Mesorhizobium sp. BHbsci]
MPHENEPGRSVVFIGGNYRRHWTAEVARKLVEFWFAHWQWTIGTAIALVALCLTIAS